MLPLIKNKPPKEKSNWHGVDGRFTQHYFSRFYQDNSLDKAARKTQTAVTFKEKEDFCNQEIEKIAQNRFVLLNISAEKEKFEKIKRKVLNEKRFLEKRIKNAVIRIQKNIRGYLCRSHNEDIMAELKKVKLVIFVKSMKKHVGECCVYLADNIVPATIVIQKYMRRYLAMKLLKRLKQEDSASRKITAFFRVLKNWSKFRKAVQSILIRKKLKEIKKRLRFIKVKLWWKRNRLRFSVIRQKSRSRNSMIVPRKTPNRSRAGSIDEHKASRKTLIAVYTGMEITPKGSISKIITPEMYGQNLDLPQAFEKIDEVQIEESLSPTLQPIQFMPPMNEELAMIENEASSVGEFREDQVFDDNEYFDADDVSISEDIDGTLGNEVETIDIEGQEMLQSPEELDDKHNREGKNKNAPPDEEQERPIPSHRRATVASTQWKKRPPTPPEPPKEIFPPPKHLLVWTKCRKIYKNQTKKYKKKIPLWKPPLGSGYTKPRRLPKLVLKQFKIPDFLEPYTIPTHAETPDSGINLNQDEDNDTYSVNSDTSYEYEAGDYKSTGLNNALPQLYSIVKSYGKNADALTKNQRNNKSIG